MLLYVSPIFRLTPPSPPLPRLPPLPSQVVLSYRVYLMYAQNQAELDEWKNKLMLNGAKWQGKLRHASRVLDDG